MTQNPFTISKKILLPLLASIMALSPLAIDLYLPAMPQIADELATTMPSVQNTLSIYLVGYACGLLFFGPLADKYPRRNLVMIGLIGFMLATFALPFATSIEAFMGMRFVQAFLSSAATVVVPGTIREIYQKNTAKGLSYVSMIMMLAPMIAPSIGSVILALHSWQAIFYALAVYACLILLFAVKQLPNRAASLASEQGEQQAQSPSFLGRYKIVLGNKPARLELIASMMISLAFFAYITAVPFVYMTVFQVSEFTFSVLFAATVGALMTAHFINTRLVVRKGSRTMLGYGLLVAVIASSALVMVNYWQLPIAYTVSAVLPLMGSISMIAVNADAIILQKFAEQSGTATAVIGVLRFGIGGLAGPILAFFYDGSAMPFSLLMWLSVLVVLLVQLPRFLGEKNVVDKTLSKSS
ncbi:MFS transporter [Thalassotalea euphylliae]|uniref:Bcr/CflA family efflux transporter n=1 Tax=Thalassotalea euphylliae TaxID=1655234 RepID=A0A3E0TXC7_9GAMM|nr:multidrug effflux MFS transporter [Thalassotalea euphylliae]REL29027.1 MFS transporter [Thalassotalea euphylliae]